MRILPALVAGALLAVPLGPAAQPRGEAMPLGEQLSRAVDIPPEDWRALAAGRTLTYRIDGAFWAMERYDTEGNAVMLQFLDGECLQGVWEYTAPHYCFHWEERGTACFRHARLDDRIVVIETQDGIETGAVQEVSDISQIPLACGPAQVS